MKLRKFKCALCKEKFIAGWSEEEAIAEKNYRFPGIPMEEMSQICDDCNQKVTEYAKKTGLFIQ